LTPREMPDDLVRMIVDRKVIGAVLSNTVTGSAWQRHMKDKAEAERRRSETAKESGAGTRAKTLAEIRAERRTMGIDTDIRRKNLEKLIAGGAVITIGTDNFWGAAPEFARTPKRESQNHGLGSIIAIEGLVELGMTPAQALVSATRNGAMACRALNDYGTLATGKIADLLVLDANPLAAISNIRKVSLVMKEGRIIDTGSLPDRPVFTTRSSKTN
jgi:imidazolonepropionase-like amidohydrolase